MILTENDKIMKKRSKISLKSNKDNLCSNNKVNPEADCFVAGPNMETDRATSI